MGGVAFETPSGQLIWDVETRAPIARLASGRMVAATPDRVVWCKASCRSLLVRDLVTGDDTSVELPDRVTGLDPDPAHAAISPDRSRLALVATVRADGSGTTESATGTTSDSESEIVVIDLDAVAAVPVPGGRVPATTVPRWSPDGRFLLWTASSYGADTTRVGRYDMDSGTTQSRLLPFGGSLSAVAVERTEARSFLPSRPGRRDDCQPPRVRPSARTGLCGFRVR